MVNEAAIQGKGNMMHSIKKLGAVLAVIAVCAIGAANSSAAQFTYSATGNIVGKALENQLFTTNGGESLVCSTAAAKGSIKSTAFGEQEMAVAFGGCKSFSFATVDTSEAKLLFKASGQIQILSALTITPTLFGSSLCTLTYPPQTAGTIGFANSGTSNVKVTPNVTGLTYTSSGGACGSSGTNGTWKGAGEWSREGGGTIRFDEGGEPEPEPEPEPKGEFTYSATGNIVGKALENQIFTTNAGEVACTTAAGKGTIKSTNFTEQEMTVSFSGCKAFSIATLDTSPAELLYKTSGQVQILKAITITPTLFGVSACTTTIPAQTVGTVAFANAGTSNVKVTPSITGITYTSSGGACGSSGTNGTLKGASEWNREGGGTIRFDP